MKRQITQIPKAFAIIIMIMIAQFAFPQGNTWKLGGNNNVGTNDFIGPTNNADFKIISNNQLRINVCKNGTTEFLGKVKMIVDTFKVKGFIQTDSMRIKGPLHIGDSSLTLGGINPFGGNDLIQSNNQAISFGRLGPNFSNIRIGIGIQSPQNMLHLNYTTPVVGFPLSPVYTQFTNSNGVIGTGTSATDGFKVGIDATGITQLNQQENQDIRFYTGNNNPTSGPILNLERMRLTTTTIYPSSSNIPNVNRISVGEKGAISNPRSLMHLGLDVTGNTPNIGWRDWMDIGTFYSTNTENLYIGFKPTNSTSQWANVDPVISWGWNMTPVAAYESRLRFIYSTPMTGASNSSNQNGIEIARMLYYNNISTSTYEPRMGIGGDGIIPANPYYPLGADPGNTLEINSSGLVTSVGGSSGLRFTHLRDVTSPPIDLQTTPNPSQGVLSVDANGDVIYVKGESFGTCANPLSLSSNGAWNLNNKNFYFEGQGLYNTNSVGIGSSCTPLIAKLDVRATQPISSNGDALGAYFSVSYNATGIGAAEAVHAESHANGMWGNIGGEFAANGNVTSTNLGLSALANGSANLQNVAIQGQANGSAGSFMVGGRFICSGSAQENMAVEARNFGSASTQLIGGLFNVVFSGAAPNKYGIIASAPTNGYTSNAQVTALAPNLAGLFNGDVFVSGYYNGISDERLKKEIRPFKSSLEKIRALTPISYEFDTATYNYVSLPRGPQIGLIASNVQNIFPNMVRQCTFPAEYDTTGTMIHDSLQVKTISFIQLIPVTIAALKELDSISTGLTARIDTLHTGIGSCAQPTILSGSSAISLNNHNLYFTSDSSSTDVNNIAIGKSCSDVPLAKLDILQNTSESSSKGIYVLNHSSGFINTVPASGIATMVDGASSDMSSFNAGGFFQAKNAILNCGVLAEAVGANNGQNSGVISVAQNSSAKNVGFLSISNGGSYAYGYKADIGNATNNFGFGADVTGGEYTCGLRTSVNNGTLMNYGVYASAPLSNAAGGPHNAAGYFDGDLVYTGGFYKASDIILKENIAPINNAMNIISQLQPKTFNFKTSDYPYLNLPTGKKYGLIAQEAETVIPEIVTNNYHPEEKDSAGNVLSPELVYKGLNYEELIPVMIQGMKEQQSVIDSLKTQIQSLLGTGSKVNNNNNGNTQYVELENVNAIILNQNDPNPFAEETNITYYIPDNVSDAKLMFYDNNGKIIKEVELTAKGNGTLHVYASNLSAGIYSYALVADGKLIDTKKMVCSK